MSSQTKKIQPEEWGDWQVEIGYSKSSWVAKRTARVWYCQYLNAKGKIVNQPSRFRSADAALAAITKAGRPITSTDKPPESGWYRVWLPKHWSDKQTFAAYWSLARLCWTRPYDVGATCLSSLGTPEENRHFVYAEPDVRHAWVARTSVGGAT